MMMERVDGICVCCEQHTTVGREFTVIAGGFLWFDVVCRDCILAYAVQGIYWEDILTSSPAEGRGLSRNITEYVDIGG